MTELYEDQASVLQEISEMKDIWILAFYSSEQYVSFECHTILCYLYLSIQKKYSESSNKL